MPATTSSRFSRAEVRVGLPYERLEDALRTLGLTTPEAAGFLLVSERTLARRRGEGRLSQAESDRLVRLLHLLDAATEAFDGNVRSGVEWLTTEKTLLGGESPLQYADTEPGYETVRDMLGAIEFNSAA